MKNSWFQILLLLTIIKVFAYAQTPSKSLAFIDPLQEISETVVRTKRGSIFFSAETKASSSSKIPAYVLVDFNPTNITRILAGISASCDNGAYYFSKVYYHQSSSSLVFFCNKNSSLLILDEDSFSVKKSIPVTSDVSPSAEVKFTSEGDSLILLFLKNIFTPSPQASQLVKINMKSQKVTESQTLNKRLSSGEIVVGFGSDGSNEYILTTQIDNLRVNLAVYSFMSTQSDYELGKLYTYSYERKSVAHYYIHQIYCVEDLVAINDDKLILFLNKKGQVVGKKDYLYFNPLSYLPNVIVAEPAFAPVRNTPVIYFCEKYSENYYEMAKFTVSRETVQIKEIAEGKIWISPGNKNQNDVLFRFIQGKPSGTFFEVLETDTFKILYSKPQSFQDLFTTDTVYSIIHNSTFLKMFDSKKDSEIKTVIIDLGTAVYPNTYQNLDLNYLYILNNPKKTTTCTITQINLMNGAEQMLDSEAERDACQGKLTQAEGINFAVIQTLGNSYLIWKREYGHSRFTYQAYVNPSFAYFDPETLSVSLIEQKPVVGWSLSKYKFVAGLFVLESSTVLKNISNWAQISFFHFGDNKVYATKSQSISVIDIKTGDTAVYSLPKFNKPTPSRLQLKNSKSSIIISEHPSVESVVSPLILDETGLRQLPGANENSSGAKATGLCSYYVVDRASANFKFVKFYNACENNEAIAI